MTSQRYNPSRIAAVMLVVALSARATQETDLQGKEVSSVAAAADKYCQQELGFAYGSSEYQACLISREEYVRSRSAMAAVL